MDITFTIEGETQVARRLLVVADNIRNFDEPLEEVGNELMSTFELNFLLGGSLFGGWQPAAKDYGHPLMEDTGELRENFGYVVNNSELTMFNTTPYFRYHQSKEARSKLPRRIMMMIDNERKNFIIRALQKYILSKRGLTRI